MDIKSSSAIENDVCAAFTMWKMFHSPITILFNNLENAENKLQILTITILNSEEVEDIFRPRYDSFLSFEANLHIEKKYEAFTTWLLGRFFYLMSCDKFERIHHLFTECQIKILDVLRINQPHVHFKLINEYNSALTSLNQFHKQLNFEIIPVTLTHFVPQNILSKEDLDLSPIFVKVTNEKLCADMQEKLIFMLSKTIIGFFDTFRFDELIQSIIDNFIYNLEHAQLSSKLIIIETVVQILTNSHFLMNNSVPTYTTYVHSVIKKIEQLLYNYQFNFVNQNDLLKFELIICDFFKVFIDYKILNNSKLIGISVKNMCDFILSETVKVNCFSSDFTEITLKLLKNTLEFENKPYKNIDYVLSYTLKEKQGIDMSVLLEYQILYELKNSFRQEKSNKINLCYVSSTWKSLHINLFITLENLMNQNAINGILKNGLDWINHVLKIARTVSVKFQEFLGFQKNIQLEYINLFMFVPKMLRVQDLCNINAKNETMSCLNSLVQCFVNAIFTAIDKNVINDFEIIVNFMLYPFSNYVKPNCEKFLSPILFELVNEEQLEAQINMLNVFSLFLVRCNMINFQENVQRIHDCIYQVHKFCVGTKNNCLLNGVIRNIIYLLSTSKNINNITYEMMFPLLLMTDTIVLRELTENLGKIFCILAGHFIIVPIPNELNYKILCFECDFEKEISDKEPYKVYNKSTNLYFNKSQFIKQENYLKNEKMLDMVFDLFKNSDKIVLKNLVNNLPNFSRHMENFYLSSNILKWINLISHEDEMVRVAMVNVIGTVLANAHDNKLDKNILDLFLNTITEISYKSVETPIVELQGTLVEMVKEIGCYRNPQVVFITIKLMIGFIILGSADSSLVASKYIIRIAEAHSINPNKIYVQYKKHFCKTIADMVIYSYCMTKCNVTDVLKKISIAFGSSSKELIIRDCHHILPYFIPSFIKIPESRELLTGLADLLTTDPSELLITNFANIYPYIYLQESNQIFKQSMTFIEKVTNINESTLKKRNIKVIHNELLMHFHDKRDLVIKALCDLSKEYTDTRVLDKNRVNLQQVADYLQPRFLGVLVYFDAKLVSKLVADIVKKRVLLSLPEIIKIMGPKYITPLKFKILAMLRTALSLTDEPFPELTCEAWNVFVHCCEVESLGPILSTIFVSILPLSKSFSVKINFIFKYLLVENEEKLKEYIPDLFFLPEANINNEFKNIIRRHVQANKSQILKEQIESYMKYVHHENMEVRIYALKYLNKLLQENRNELHKLILDSNGMDPTIEKMMDVLTTGCRESDTDLRLASGLCIAEVGAIEPSHFPRKYTQANSNFIFYLTDDIFVINALMELIRAFQIETHTQNMDRYALAIQEILKAYSISPDESCPKANVWNSFPDHIQELMLPLLSSRYTVAYYVDKEITTHPIYGSNAGSSFREWIYNWTCHLIFLTENDKKPLLNVCKPSLKQDYRTLIFFLPQILIHAIIESSEPDRVRIYDEFIAVLNGSNSNNKLDFNRLTYRPLKDKTFTSSQSFSQQPEDNNQSKYINVIFILLDYLFRWLGEWVLKNCPAIVDPMSDKHYKIIHNFMNQFCPLQIAKCNYVWGEYPRALIYLEKYVENDKAKLNEQLGFIARIYAELEEPDGVAGAMDMLQNEPTMEDIILSHRVSGQLQDAAACYERMAQENQRPQYLREMVQCYLELDNPYTAFNIAEGAVEKHPEYKAMLYETQAEPFWRLNMYEELSNLLAKPELKSNTSWGVRIGQALIYFRNGMRVEFKEEIMRIHKIVIDLLNITSLEEGVYSHGYPYIIKLHILNELQKAEEVVYKIIEVEDKKICENAINNLVEEWDLRLKIIQSSIRLVEPVLCLRRIILEQSQIILGSQSDKMNETFNKHIAKYWLKSAEVARKARNFQQSYIYILKADLYKPMELFIEKAKLYWEKDEQELAFSTLKRGIEEHFPDAASYKELSPEIKTYERKLCAKAKLLIATYNDETANVDRDVNICNYKEAVDMHREWEKSWVCLAQYYDRVFLTMNIDETDMQSYGEIQIHIINCFGKSLQFGTNFIYQSMPRMLSIWFDFGTRMIETKCSDTKSAAELKKNVLCKMIKLIDTYLDKLPAYAFLSAFSQLVSRICHPMREVYLQIKSILIKLILKYPQHSMWLLLAVSKSSYSTRAKRCQEMLQDQRLKNSKVIRLVYDFNRLAEKLIDLCNKPITDGTTIASVNNLLRTLPRLLHAPDFSEIMLPTQKLRKLILPNIDENNRDHNPFPNNYVYIADIEDEVRILQSLQKPRKITFRGSDGKKYVHMLKSRDDLRKDSRMMEFNDVVNLYLHREAESRERRLYIRTYSVVPLNEDCGIIEWLDNLVGLRPAIISIYKKKGIYTNNRTLKNLMCNLHDSLLHKREIFEKQLLPLHPPVLSKWFKQMFPDAHCWYQARTAYTRTSAVISMVGYILGLGDRHGENILIDSTNGDTVHVDFNCLFNKGESFDWPERVPFRLTQNIIEAMGPLGVEGIFRKTGCITLKVLKKHTATLMSIVRPFVYDPLLSWPRNQLVKPGVSDERTNEQAVEHIRNIEYRLNGMIKTRGKSLSISLSVEGQTNFLIQEATNIDNLSQMYIGWGAYL